MAKQREEYDSMMKRMGGGITTGNPMQIFDTTKPLVETQPQPAVDPAVQQEMARRQYLQARGLAAGKAYEEKQAAQLEKSRQFLEAKRRIQGMSKEAGQRILAKDKAVADRAARMEQRRADKAMAFEQAKELARIQKVQPEEIKAKSKVDAATVKAEQRREEALGKLEAEDKNRAEDARQFNANLEFKKSTTETPEQRAQREANNIAKTTEADTARDAANGITPIVDGKVNPAWQKIQEQRRDDRIRIAREEGNIEAALIAERSYRNMLEQAQSADIGAAFQEAQGGEAVNLPPAPTPEAPQAVAAQPEQSEVADIDGDGVTSPEEKTRDFLKQTIKSGIHPKTGKELTPTQIDRANKKIAELDKQLGLR